MTAGPGVSTVIVSYRTPELTERAVRSALADPSVTEVVVVDNASGDGSIARLEAIGDARIIVAEKSGNIGFGRAANAAAEHASGDVMVFLNSDARLTTGAVETLISELDRWDGRALVGPRVMGEDGVIQRSAGLLPRLSDLVIRALGLHLVAHAADRTPIAGGLLRATGIGTEYATSIDATRAVDTSMVSGVCFAIGRSAFLELGGFDDRYFVYFEDADLCRRANAAGIPIRFVPEALVVHVGAASSTGDYRFGPLHGPSMVVYLRRWYGRAGAWIGLLLLAVRAVGLSLTRPKDAGAARRALVGGIRAYRRGRSMSAKPASVPSP